MITALFSDPARPFIFGVDGIEPACRRSHSCFTCRAFQFGRQRTVQRQRLDDGRIKSPRHIGHEAAHPPGMVDQGRKRLPTDAADRAFQSQPAKPCFDQIIVERSIILEVKFVPSFGHFVERRLRDVEMARLDNRLHLPVEEGEQQSADVRTVDICVGHDHNLVIAQLVEVEIVANTGAHRLDQRADLLR